MRWDSLDSHGKEVVRSVAELERGPSYGPDRGVRLIAATLDPAKLTPESTWYLATSLPLTEATPEHVDDVYRLREGIEHSYKPVKHELGWADYQMRPEQAIVRHWQLVLLAFTCSLLVGAWPGPGPTGASPTATLPSATPEPAAGEKSARASTGCTGRVVWSGTLRRVRAWLCPWARLQLYWQRWSSTAPPPELAALLAHVANARPLEAPT